MVFNLTLLPPSPYLSIAPLSVSTPSDCTSPLSPLCSPVWLGSQSSDEEPPLMFENCDTFTPHQDLYDVGMGELHPVTAISWTVALVAGMVVSNSSQLRHRGVFHRPVVVSKRSQLLVLHLM